MATDRTVNERIARYRERQQQRGMVVVRVWVPTKEDAEEIKRRAAEMRAAFAEQTP